MHFRRQAELLLLSKMSGRRTVNGVSAPVANGEGWIFQSIRERVMRCVGWMIGIGLVVCLSAGIGWGEPPSGKAKKRELVVQSGHAGPIWAVAFSPDGKQVLTGSGDGTAIVWDA